MPAAALRLGWGGVVAACLMGAQGQGAGPATAMVALSACRVEGVEARCGVYAVFENRRSRQGRLLPLKIVVIPAVRPHPEEGPVFYLAGGPGETATEMAAEYLGSWRVKDQMAACKEWPKTDLPGGYFEPFRSEVPAVLISGGTDPVAPPRWGREVASFLPNAIHVVVPTGGHTPENVCTRSLRGELFRTGSTRGLDLSCVASLRPVPFKLPAHSQIGDLSCLRP
jgi:pimeloyl-ACP methyl ester carboxylesterase